MLAYPLGGSPSDAVLDREEPDMWPGLPIFGGMTVFVEGMVASGHHSSKTTHAYISHCTSINTLTFWFLF